jgi:hypothetical protein
VADCALDALAPRLVCGEKNHPLKPGAPARKKIESQSHTNRPSLNFFLPGMIRIVIRASEKNDFSVRRGLADWPPLFFYMQSRFSARDGVF